MAERRLVVNGDCEWTAIKEWNWYRVYPTLIRFMVKTMLSGEIAEQGFAITNGIFSNAEIRALEKELQLADLPRSRAGTRHALRNSAVAKIANHPSLLGMAREVLGVAAIPYRATLFDKSPVSNWLVIWHQDKRFPCARRTRLPDGGRGR
jgi:hypothetical protein